MLVVDVVRSSNDRTRIDRLDHRTRRIGSRTWIEVGRNVIRDAARVVHRHGADSLTSDPGLRRQIVDIARIYVRVAGAKRRSGSGKAPVVEGVKQVGNTVIAVIGTEIRLAEVLARLEPLFVIR